MEFTPDSPLPPVREDVSAVEYAPGVVAIYDESGYADEPVSLAIDDVRWLARLDGALTALDLAAAAAIEHVPFDVDRFVGLVAMLDAECLLDSPTYWSERERIEGEFATATIRPAAFQGISYPEEPVELASRLDEILMAASDEAIPTDPPVAIVAPHIDFRVGGSTYGPAYKALSHSDAETFIVFGTSHQMSHDRFMISTKDYDTPLGPLPTDREFIESYRERLPFELTTDDIAHRREHSIEFQAVFIRHIFRDRPVRIVPILTGSLHEYVEYAQGSASKDDRLTILYSTLEETAAALGRRICYVAGADMSHIGRKFGDSCDARGLLREARDLDARALSFAAQAEPDRFIGVLAEFRNKYRVCGVAPIYATIRSARPRYGILLAHDTWDETERGSAVTFASMAFYGKNSPC